MQDFRTNLCIRQIRKEQGLSQNNEKDTNKRSFMTAKLYVGICINKKRNAHRFVKFAKKLA